MFLDRLQSCGRLSKTEHREKNPADDPRLSIQTVFAKHMTGALRDLLNCQIIPAYVTPRTAAASTTLTTSTTRTGLPKNPPARLDRHFYDMAAFFVHDRLLSGGKHAHGC